MSVLCGSAFGTAAYMALMGNVGLLRRPQPSYYVKIDRPGGTKIQFGSAADAVQLVVRSSDSAFPLRTLGHRGSADGAFYRNYTIGG